MLTHIITTALGPIVFGLAVGWLSGAYNFVKREYAQAFAEFVVKIALPIALFLAALSSSAKSILDVDFALAIGVGLLATFIIAYLYGKIVSRYGNADSTMQALSASFPDMAYCGPPIILAAVGTSGMISIVVGNLIYTVIILPISLMMISGGKGSGQSDQSMSKLLLKSVSQPLVFLPILGAILAVAGVKLPAVVTDSMNELGKTAGGVALFFLGLFLSGVRLKLKTEIIVNVILKNIVQGAIVLGVGLALGLEGDLLKAAFIIGILPTATAVPSLAVAHDVYAEQSASTVLLSTVVSLVTMALGIVVVVHL